MIIDKPLTELKDKMEKIKQEMSKTKNKKTFLQLQKCYHRLEKQVAIYMMNKYGCKIYKR